MDISGSGQGLVESSCEPGNRIIVYETKNNYIADTTFVLQVSITVRTTVITPQHVSTLYGAIIRINTTGKYISVYNKYINVLTFIPQSSSDTTTIKHTHIKTSYNVIFNRMPFSFIMRCGIQAETCCYLL